RSAGGPEGQTGPGQCRPALPPRLAVFPAGARRLLPAGDHGEGAEQEPRRRRHEHGPAAEADQGVSSSSRLPFGPPVEPMLAKLQRELPPGEGWLYEPKWDGFRSIVWRDGDEVYVQSRDLKPFNRYFPELLPALAEGLPDPCVVDGEIVVASADGTLD